MEKKAFFAVTIILCLAGTTAECHTISKHLEEIFERAYLPLSALVTILPFAGIALLIGKGRTANTSIKHHWLFLLACLVGAILGWSLHDITIVQIINKGSIAVIGMLLLFQAPARPAILSILTTVLGCSLGYENMFLIAHGGDFIWFYTTTAATGIVLFFVIYALIKPNRKMHVALGIFYIFSGLITLLLA